MTTGAQIDVSYLKNSISEKPNKCNKQTVFLPHKMRLLPALCSPSLLNRLWGKGRCICVDNIFNRERALHCSSTQKNRDSNMKRFHLVSRLANVCLGLVLLFLAGYSISTAALIRQASSAAETSTHLSDLYRQILYTLSIEE